MPRPPRFPTALWLANFVALWGLVAPARAEGVTHVVIHGELDAGTLALVERGMKSAKSAGHEQVVLEIDTPGGEIQTMWTLSKMVREASEEGLLTVAWVHDNATSAGSLLSLSCDRILMVRASTIGSATPVTFGPAGMEEAPEKVLSYVRAQFRAVATEQGRSPELAEAMVDPDVGVYWVRDASGERLMSADEYEDRSVRPNPPEIVRTVVRRGELLNATGPEAVELGLADGLADSLDEVLSIIGCTACPVTTIERRRSEDLLAHLSRFSGLLLLAGILLAWTEIKAPGFGAPGILSIACFAVLLVGQYFVGLADIPHIVLVGLGIALVAVELFLVPGTIWVGLVGFVLALAGLVLAQLGPGFAFSNPLDQRLLLDVAYQMTLLMIAALVGAFLLSRYLPGIPVLRRLVLQPAGPAQPAEAVPEARDERAHPGACGRAITDLRPVGSVVLDVEPDHRREARAEALAIEAGTPIVVVEVRAGRLVVAPAAEGGQTREAAAEEGNS